MVRSFTQILKARHAENWSDRYRTGISLHSHTMYSREYLHRLPDYIRRVPIASSLIELEIGRMHMYTGRTIDFRKVFWTPPLSAREALALEEQQIVSQLGLRPIVSLTDHDSVEAGLHLNMLGDPCCVPVSVEWSAPFGKTVFHIGVHNLPAAEANQWMEEFSRYAAQPSLWRLRELFCELNANPGVLLVLNHPFWDAEGSGPELHRSFLDLFLEEFRSLIHALELNGMRSRRENRQVVELGKEVDLPVISGGDRHGCEPNTTLNVSAASNFEEFAHEIRVQRRSDVALMPQFFDALQIRILESAYHALSDAPGEFGRRHWMTRVFYQDRDGVACPLSAHMGTRIERFVEPFRRIMGFLSGPLARPALRAAFLGNEEGGL
jgi:hypothetical protein